MKIKKGGGSEAKELFLVKIILLSGEFVYLKTQSSQGAARSSWLAFREGKKYKTQVAHHTKLKVSVWKEGLLFCNKGGNHDFP